MPQQRCVDMCRLCLIRLATEFSVAVAATWKLIKALFLDIQSGHKQATMSSQGLTRCRDLTVENMIDTEEITRFTGSLFGISSTRERVSGFQQLPAFPIAHHRTLASRFVTAVKPAEIGIVV